MKTINEIGLNEIKIFLAENHKLGDQFTDAMLSAWASDAEFQMSEGNPPTIEIKQADSISGRTVTYTVSDAGVDNGRDRYAHASATQPATPSKYQVLKITTAYEQGVGKGRDAHDTGKEVDNPYSDAWNCAYAWAIGYEEGKLQAARIAADPKAAPPEPTPTVTVRYDLSPHAIEGAIRNRLIEMGWTPPDAPR